MSLENLILDVDQGLSNVNLVNNSCFKKFDRNDNALWSGDFKLSESIKTIKNISTILSDSVTKLNLIASKFPDQLDSIVQEVHQHTGQLINLYFEFSSLPSSKALYFSVFHNIISVLTHLKCLLLLLEKKEFSSINSVTGMIWKTVEDINKIPINNKASYRRHWMEDISAGQDTLREFHEYLNQSKAKLSITSNDGSSSENKDIHYIDTIQSDVHQEEGEELKEGVELKEGEELEEGDENDEEDDNDDEEADDVYHTIELCHEVEHYMHRMNSSLIIMKLGLQIMTIIGDASIMNKSDLINKNSMNETVLIPKMNNMTLSTTDDNNVTSVISNDHINKKKDVEQNENESNSLDSHIEEDKDKDNSLYITSVSRINMMTNTTKGVQVWISELIHLRELLLKAITNLGCELYPPLDSEDSSTRLEYSRTMTYYTVQLKRILSLPIYTQYLSSEIMNQLQLCVFPNE